ncbi:MAG: DUF2203 family protein [Candidatus Gracilibacteria bacterium]|jgi:hypothetical protein
MGKTFTLEEANRSLVFVAQVLREVQKNWDELMTSQGAEDKLSEAVIQGKINRLKACNEELDQVGCIMRDPIEGLLDFPSFYKDRPVFLSWKLGEEQVEFWHELNENPRHRRSANEEFVAWNSSIPLPDLNLA